MSLKLMNAVAKHHENWIAKATKNKGALHRQLGVPEGKTIPESKLEKAKAKGGIGAKRANLAETLKKLHK